MSWNSIDEASESRAQAHGKARSHWKSVNWLIGALAWLWCPNPTVKCTHLRWPYPIEWVCVGKDILFRQLNNGPAAGAKIFPKLDANSGFWQNSLPPESIPLTMYIAPFRGYCFNFWHHISTQALSMLHVWDTRWPIWSHLIDDVLICGRTQEEHDERLFKVLCRLQKAQ